MMEIRQISLKEANAFVSIHHRHHDVVVGHKFSLGLYVDGELHGVAIVGRPVSRYLDNGKTLEVTRLCTDGYRNACSCLYSAAAREAKKRGYEKIITYILVSENGASLRAANWVCEAKKCGKPKWNAQRYADKPKQLSLFTPKSANEYKQRYAYYLNERK